jgi:hypothetical protein
MRQGRLHPYKESRMAQTAVKVILDNGTIITGKEQKGSAELAMVNGEFCLIEDGSYKYVVRGDDISAVCTW